MTSLRFRCGVKTLFIDQTTDRHVEDMRQLRSGTGLCFQRIFYCHDCYSLVTKPVVGRTEVVMIMRLWCLYWVPLTGVTSAGVDLYNYFVVLASHSRGLVRYKQLSFLSSCAVATSALR